MEKGVGGEIKKGKVREMAKKGYEAEAEFKKKLENMGWLVMRVSGSIGAGDLVAMSASSNKIYQIKSTTSNVFYFDKQTKSEVERLFDIEATYGIPCYLAIKFKRGKGRKGVWVIRKVSEVGLNNNYKPIKYEVER